MKHIKFLFALVIAAMTGASSWADINPTLTLDNGVILTFEIEKIDTTDCQLIRLNDNSIGVDETYTLNIPATITYESREYAVTEIITRFCEGNTKIKGLFVPSTVKTVGQYAFKDCTSLETITLSEGVEKIGLAFQNTGIIEMPEIPSTVTQLVGTFSDCKQLKRATIPATITFLQNTFSGCTAMEDVYFNITSWKTTVFNSPTFTNQVETLFGNLPNVTLRIHVSEEIYLAFKNKLTSWFFYTSQETDVNPCARLVVDTMAKVGDRGLALVEAVDKTTGAVGARYAARIVYISVDGERKAIIYGGDYTSTDNLDENPCWHGYTSQWGIHYSGAFEKLSTPTAYSNMRLTLPSKVEDSHGNIYTVIGLGAFATYYCSFYGVEDIRIPKTYTHLGTEALKNFSYLQNYVVIPSSVKQLGSPAGKSPSDIFADESNGTGDDNRVMSVYFLHRDANVTWYETSTNQYFRWKNYDNRKVYLRVNQSIIDAYCGSDVSWNGFKAWSNHISLGSDRTYHQELATQPVWNPAWVAYISGTQKHYEPGEYSLTVYNDRFRLPVALEHFSSTNEDIVEITRIGTASNGDNVVWYNVKAAGEANIVFHYPGDDVFDELTSTVKVISKSETLCGDQTLNNSYNTVGTPSTGVTKINLTQDELYSYNEEYEQSAMTIADNKLYVSLSSNEYYDSYYGGLMLRNSPELLTPNYGAAYRTAYAANGSEGVSEMVASVDYGGLLCFKVPSGKGVITVEGSLYDSQSILGIRVFGNAEKRLTNSNEWEYEYDVADDSWAYIYGINLGVNDSYRAYVKSITIQPEGAPMPKVSFLGQDVNDYSNLNDLLGDGGSVAFSWGYPGETDVTEETAQAATLILTNASLINNNGPAIEVNSLNTFIILVEGDNTVQGTGAASISMGTLSGYDWDGTALIIVNEGNAATLTIPNSAQYGIYNYDGAAQILNLTSVDIAGTECGFYINNVSGTSGGGGEVYKAADNTKSVGSYYIGQLVINNVQSAKFSGDEAAVYGLSVAPESNDDSNCIVLEIDPEDAVFNSYVGSYIKENQSYGPIKGVESSDYYDYATMVRFGLKPIITIFGRDITRADFLNSTDGTIALDQEGKAVLSWEVLENGPKSSKSDAKGDEETLYDYGYPVLTLNGANISYTGNGPAIEVNTYNYFFIRVKGSNTITATNAKNVISVGTAKGNNDTSSWTSLIILNDDEQTGGSLPSLTLNNNRSTKGDGIYVYRGSVDVQNCAVNVNAPTYALHYFFESYTPKKAIGHNRYIKSETPQKVVTPDGPVGYAGYLNIHEGSELTLNGADAALWGVTYFYLENVGAVESDLNDYKTQYTYCDGPYFVTLDLDYGYYGSYQMWVSNDGDDWEQKYAKFVQIAPNVIYKKTVEDVEMKFTIVSRLEKAVKVGDENWNCAIDNSYSGLITIPDTVKGYDVVGIYGGAFYGSGITSVSFPETEKFSSIDSYAFQSCALETVVIPDNVTSLGWDAFDGCSSLTSATIGEGITELQGYTFRNCESLEEVKLPRGLRSLGYSEFYNCSSLSRVYCYEETPPSLSSSAFTNLPEGAKLYVPYGCKSDFENSAWINYFSSDNIVEMADESVWFEYENVTYKIIGKGTVQVGNGTETALSPLAIVPDTLTIPGTVTREIDGQTYTYTVTKIGKNAFNTNDVQGVSVVIIPASVWVIGSYAFQGIENLQSAYVYSTTPPTIDEYSFNSGVAEATLYVPIGCVDDYWKSSWSCFGMIDDMALKFTVTVNGVNMTFKTNGENTVQTYGYWNDDYAVTAIPSDYSGPLTIPESVEYNGVTYTVTAIGDESFDAYDLDLSLTEVTLPSTITSIGGYAFDCCSAITKMTVYATTPPDLAEYSLSLAKDATLFVPDESVEAYQASAWSNYFIEILGMSQKPVIFTVNVDGIPMTFKVTSAEEGNYTVQTYGSFGSNGYPVPAIPVDTEGTVTIPETVVHEDVTYTVTAIGDVSFAVCENLTGVNIPNTVTSIGQWAFCESGITSITLPEGITSINPIAFGGCLALQSVYANMTTPVELPIMQYDESSIYYVFDPLDTDQTRTLYVPAGCKDAYTASDWWTQGAFSEIVEEGGGTELEPGDVSGDGAINVTDVTALVSIILGNASSFTESQRKAADLNNDGVVNVSDVTALVSIILNQ
ncbi:MAG: leucine-rich repeat protein [Bacteroidaceae bacterium]|nr:leucine-rich repeat protein [Bacteroidaceae bacterium]